MTTETTKIHDFEKAGLGRAPFTFKGAYEDRGPHTWTDPKTGITTSAGAPGQPMGTCAYCGQGIAIICSIEDADGKRFTVGSDCVKRTGDRGLHIATTTVQRIAREATQKREDVRIKELAARLASDMDLQAFLRTKPHPQAWRREKGDTLLEWTGWMLANSGHAGRMTVVRTIERLLAPREVA
jgi:hypothetical protein